MFLVLLRFAENKGLAVRLISRHNEWIQRGFDDEVFLLTGTLERKAGGAIIAYGVSRADLETRVAADPFVAERVVTAEFVELTPSKADARLAFVLPR